MKPKAGRGTRYRTWARAEAVLLALLAAGAALALEPLRADDRPTIHAAAVADGAITVDGRVDEWNFTPPPLGSLASAADSDHVASTREPWGGPGDLSCGVLAAADSRFLYLAASVRDPLLFNDGGPENPWVGDDFEVYVDANPPETRFQKGLNENYTQFIFVPEHLWKEPKGTFVWKSDKFPGVRAASRLTPTGYTIEIAIPKDLFPNWKARPDLDSVGFDAAIGDMDTPGVIGHDPAAKAMLFLLRAQPHFQSAANVGLLRFDAKALPPGAGPAARDSALPGYSQAQELLDHFGDPGVGREAAAALAQPGSALARKAALFLFYRRPGLAADAAPMIAALKEPADDSLLGPLLDGRAYAMLALAERHELPAADLFDAYARNDDPLLRRSFIYALGINGDKSAAGRLAALYPESAGRDREFIALSLAELGDATGAPTLKALALRDAKEPAALQPFSHRCAELLKQLGIEPAP